MKITEEINKCREMMSFDKNLIIDRIAEAYNNIQNNQYNDDDLFMAGLRYPEYLVNIYKTNDYDSDLNAAYNRVKIYRYKLDIEETWLIKQLTDLYGLK